MPKFQVTTKSANSVWKSPDGQREIFEVTLDYNGEDVNAKTYSNDISTVGWAGEVETYEKEGKNRDGSPRAETFVKQPQKEGGSYGGGYNGGSRGSYTPRDDSHIKAQWAIGQSVIVHNETPELSSADLDSVETLAVELFKMVDRVKATPVDEAVHGPSDTPTGDAALSEQMDKTMADMPDDFLKDVEAAFPGAEPVAKPKEAPWPKS